MLAKPRSLPMMMKNTVCRRLAKTSVLNLLRDLEKPTKEACSGVPLRRKGKETAVGNLSVKKRVLPRIRVMCSTVMVPRAYLRIQNE